MQTPQGLEDHRPGPWNADVEGSLELIAPWKECSCISLSSLMCSRRQARNNEILRRGYGSAGLCGVLHKPPSRPPHEQTRQICTSTMDSVIFYKPPLIKQPARSSAACAASAASTASATSIACVPTVGYNARPAISQRGKEEIGKVGQVIKYTDVSHEAEDGAYKSLLP